MFCVLGFVKFTIKMSVTVGKFTIEMSVTVMFNGFAITVVGIVMSLLSLCAAVCNGKSKGSRLCNLSLWVPYNCYKYCFS